MMKIQKPRTRNSRLLLASTLALVLLLSVSQVFLFSGIALADDVGTSVTIGGGGPSNNLPTAPAVNVVPDNPDPGEDLTCFITTPSSDADGDPVKYTYNWYKNGLLQSGLTKAVTTDLTYTIDGSGTIAGEIWKCVVTPRDLVGNGPSAEDQVTVTPNNLPTSPVVDVVPDNPDPGVGLTCLITTESSDADGDPVTYTYEWYKNGVLQSVLTKAGTTDLMYTIDGSGTIAGEIWKCVVTPNDSIGNGPSAEDQVTIVTISGNGPPNDLPTAPVVNVFPDTPDPGEDLTCLITTQSVDVDGDQVTYTYEWYKNGVLQSGLTKANTTDLTYTIDGSGTIAGEIWKCVVTPSDLVGNGPSAEDQVTISEGTLESSGGGGGGGGGGGSLGITGLNDYINGDGQFVTNNAIFQSADGKVTLYVPLGTYGLNKNGQRLSFISIKPLDTPPDPPDDYTFVCLNYNLGPNGATFDPPAILTFKYDDSQIAEGFAEENLVLVIWIDGQWKFFDNCIVDPVNNTISVLIDHFSIFTVMANTTPASFEVSGIIVTPNEVYPDETVTVSVTITNTGSLVGSKEVTLKINGQPIQTTNVTLNGGKSQTVSFTLTSASGGEYTVEVNGLWSTFNVKEPVPEGTVTEVTPAGFIISGLSITPDEVNTSGEVTISAVVTNTGGSEGSYTVILKINDVEEASKEITLGAGQNEKVTFTIAKDIEGVYSVDVAGNTGQFTVTLPPPATNVPEETAPVQSSTNWWIIAGTVAGTLVAIRIAVFIFRKRPEIS